MCFSSKEDPGPDAAPKPAQIPLKQPTSSASPFGKLSIPHAEYPSRTDYAPPVGPPPSKAPTDAYAAPPGPPPGHKTNDEYAPPPGPPPGQQIKHEYAPPPDPPPSQDYAPPTGPPPSQEPEKQDWEVAVPDTAGLPPPPNFFSGFDESPTNNASGDEAIRGEEWCKTYPLYQPMRPDNRTLDSLTNALQMGNINLFKPNFYTGNLEQTGLGVWKGSFGGFSGGGPPEDLCLASYPPLYTVAAHSPLATGRKKTIYYEVNILKDSNKEVILALGYTAPPYPSFRLPGWHRGSVGVHGDDGHKYINDLWGGKSFTLPFRCGQTVGLGMDFIPGVGGGIQVEIFFTRDGVEDGRWDLHEERDAVQDREVTGLDGFHDLCAAIGLSSKVAFEIVFAPGRWKWKGYQG